MENPPDFVLVDKVQGLETAEIIKGRLESEGIPVYVKYDATGKIYGIICDGLGEVGLFVPQEYVKEARRILYETDANS